MSRLLRAVGLGVVCLVAMLSFGQKPRARELGLKPGVFAQEAHELKQEWTLLQIPAPSDHATKKELETKEAALRTRMVDLLSRILKGL